MSPGVFRNELAHARTFGFMSDVERLWKAGLALGANLTNTVAIGDDRIMNREGLRDPLEFVRHKMLDAVGDLSLSGYPLLGAYRSVRGGHRLNSLVLKALLEDPSAWTHRAGSAGSRRSPARLRASRPSLRPASKPFTPCCSRSGGVTASGCSRAPRGAYAARQAIPRAERLLAQYQPHFD